MTQDMLTAVNDLAEVLALENAALTRLDFRGAVALSPAKGAALLAVTSYQPPADDRDPLLAALGRRMKRLVLENRALLERAIAVQTRIVGIIARAGVPAPAAGQYAANGFKSQPRRAAAVALLSRA